MLDRYTEQAEWVQEVSTTHSRQEKPFQYITVNKNELSDATLLNNMDEHQRPVGVIKMDQHSRRDSAGMKGINRFTQDNTIYN